MDFEIETNQIPAYAQFPVRRDELRILSFESDGRETVRKQFTDHGLMVLNCWTNDPLGRVRLDVNGDVLFRASPGTTVFVAVKAA